MRRSGTHCDLRKRFELTDRQREVLDLVADGYTNGEIGRALGISLDGAKWHVSEIIGKLGVSSREEAAAYWQAYNRPTARLARAFGGVFSMELARWAGIGVASLVIAGGVILAANAITGGSESDADSSPTVVQTPEPSPAESPDGEPVDSVLDTAVALDEGGPVALPEGVVVFYYGASVPQEGASQVLRRARRTGETTALVDLYEGLPTDGQPIFSTAFDFEAGRLAVAVCVSGDCGGGQARPSPSAETALFVSEDGGISWSEIESPPATGIIDSFLPDGRLLVSIVEDNVMTYVAWPGGEPIARPAGAFPVRVGSELLWISDDGTLVDGNGVPRIAPPQLPTDAPYRAIPGGLAGIAMWVPESGTSGTSYMSEVDENGELGRTVVWQGMDLRAVARIDADRILALRLGRADGESGAGAFIVDFRDGAFHEIEGLRRDGDVDAYPVGAVVGPFVRVNSGDECLNVREEPSLSAPISACVNTGVLLRDLVTEQSADDVTWRSVALPDGRTGWASMEFLD